MSITYPDHIVVDRSVADSAVTGTTPVTENAPYTPVYARSGKARNGRKAVKTWMILAPVGAIVLIGGAVAMAFGGESSAPLGAPVPAESMPAALPMVSDAAPAVPTAPAAAAPVANVAPAPMTRQAVETRSRAPATRPRVAPAAVVVPVEAAPPPAGPQPYVSVAAPPATAAPAPPTPVLPPETLSGPPID